MYQAGLIDGYTVAGGREFRPDALVMRQQFAKMIVNALKLPVSEADMSTFGDVEASPPGDLYPDHYIAVAAANGITQGIHPGEFGPYESIKRAQILTMVVRAMRNLHSGTLTEPPAAYTSAFGDFSADHAANLRVAEYNGLTLGIGGYYPGLWDPMAYATRGEVAQILWRLGQKMMPTDGNTSPVTLSAQVPGLHDSIAFQLVSAQGESVVEEGQQGAVPMSTGPSVSIAVNNETPILLGVKPVGILRFSRGTTMRTTSWGSPSMEENCRLGAGTHGPSWAALVLMLSTSPSLGTIPPTSGPLSG
jgi:S-layer homology domain